jgi:hypothetical protein
MRYALPAIFFLAVWAYAFFDCATTEQERVRNLPKWGWLLIILFFDIFGSIAWFIGGRPRNNPGGRGPKRKFIAPDDNPDFLRKL